MAVADTPHRGSAGRGNVGRPYGTNPTVHPPTRRFRRRNADRCSVQAIRVALPFRREVQNADSHCLANDRSLTVVLKGGDSLVEGIAEYVALFAWYSTIDAEYGRALMSPLPVD
jgi:hypothetical protein